MSSTITARLSSKAHPEYDPITVSFPIPDEEYDDTVRQLERLSMDSFKDDLCQRQ